MKVLNPHYQHPLDVKAADYKTAVDDWLANEAVNNRAPTFDDLRAKFPAATDGMTDGFIADMLGRMGYTVE